MYLEHRVKVLTVILGFMFFCVRGILLWIVVPAAICVWLLVLPGRAAFRRPYLRAGKVIGWADLNVSAILAQILLRPVGGPVAFVPWSQIDAVQHRVSWIDPW
jgi:hypothetical protein